MALKNKQMTNEKRVVGEHNAFLKSGGPYTRPSGRHF